MRHDPETGNLIWIERTAHRIQCGDIAGRVRPDGYRVVMLDTHLYLCHRLIWFYCLGKWPESGLDHIDGNPSNNRLDNLREATSSQNHGNMKMFATNTSGFTGVSYHKRLRRWVAEITHRRQKFYLGLYDTPEEASTVYRSEHEKRFGKFERAA